MKSKVNGYSIPYVSQKEILTMYTNTTNDLLLGSCPLTLVEGHFVSSAASSLSVA